eukprot:5348667-Pleurochrysis_carterae.AAC.2
MPRIKRGATAAVGARAHASKSAMPRLNLRQLCALPRSAMGTTWRQTVRSQRATCVCVSALCTSEQYSWRACHEVAKSVWPGDGKALAEACAAAAR